MYVYLNIWSNFCDISHIFSIFAYVKTTRKELIALNIVKMLAPSKSSARPSKKLSSFLGVTIHETDNTNKGANAINHASYLKNNAKTLKKSWHYCVDEKCITQSIPEDEVAYHSGTTKGNYYTIAIEICVNSDGDFKKALDNAAELTADILKRKGITKNNFTSYLFQHNHWSGKNCPRNLRASTPYSWAYFVDLVSKHFDGVKKPSAPFSVGDSVTLNGYLYVDSYASIKGKRMTNFKATITKIAPSAYLRKAPYLLNNGLGWVREEDITK